jgi:hypothetical protein
MLGDARRRYCGEHDRTALVADSVFTPSAEGIDGSARQHAEPDSQDEQEAVSPYHPIPPIYPYTGFPFNSPLAFRSPFSFFLENNRGNRGNRGNRERTVSLTYL